MISESQRLERLAERLRAIEPAQPSPAAKIRAWNLALAELQKPAARARSWRSSGRLILAGFAAAALLLAGAVGAAADSLPDSALYPVKGVIENVEGAFALSAADKFSYHLGLARTRLREAEAMFARHRTDLADRALSGLDDQLTSAANLVQSVKANDPAVAGSLEQELQQAIQTHDNQLAGLQGQVTNPTAISAITRARNRALDAMQLAAAPADHGQGKGAKASPSPKGRGQGQGQGQASPSNTVKPSHQP